MKQPKRVTDLAELEPAFEADVRALLADLAAARLPVKVFETRRSLERQRWLHGQGVSKATGTQGPHVHGLAVDIVLDIESPLWAERGCMPVVVGESGAAWDTGIEVLPVSNADGTASERRAVLLRPGVALVVSTMGAMALARGLDWGGVNSGAWRSSKPGDLFGWDPAHIQRRRWRTLVPAIAAAK